MYREDYTRLYGFVTEKNIHVNNKGKVVTETAVPDYVETEDGNFDSEDGMECI